MSIHLGDARNMVCGRGVPEGAKSLNAEFVIDAADNSEAAITHIEPSGAPGRNTARFGATEHELFVTANAGVETLRFLPLRLRCRSKDLRLGGLAGPLWRSGFGAALARHFPGVFSLLFAEQARLGRLYALRPPFEEISPGGDFELGLNLFGEATEYAVVCAQALARLGEMGLGTPRGFFDVLSARVEGQPDFLHRDEGLRYWPLPLQVARWCDEGRAVSRLQLRLRTPLRIKDGNAVLNSAPDFHQVIRRVLGRLAQICEAAGERNPLSPSDAERLLTESGLITTLSHDVHWAEIKRRSSRTAQTMHFGGLVGDMTFAGNLTPFAGLLALSECMQLGGKTTFGFGCLQTMFFNEE